MRRFLLLPALTIAIAGAAIAQPPDTSALDVTVSASLARNEVFLGDTVSLFVTVTFPKTHTVIPPPASVHMGNFEGRDYNLSDPVEYAADRYQNRTRFVISSFELGPDTIPPLPIAVVLPDGSRRELYTEPVPVEVKSVMSQIGGAEDIRPLKEYEPPTPPTNPLPWIVLGGLLVAGVIGLVLWLRYRAKQGPKPVVDNRPPWEIAFARLALLKQEHLPESGEFKAYYFAITEIVRDYLGHVYEKPVLDMTTDEFLFLAESLPIPDATRLKLRSFLRHADLVKFAKLVPTMSRSEEDFAVAHDIIEQVRAELERRQQLAAASPVVATAGGAR